MYWRSLFTITLVSFALFSAPGYSSDKNLNNQLLKAIVENDTNGAEKLIQQGADVNSSKNKFKILPLIKAVKASSIEMIELLLKHHAEIDKTDEGSLDFPLKAAVMIGSKKKLELLIEHGANVDLVDPLYKVSALDAAATVRNRDAAMILLQAGASKGNASRKAMAVGDKSLATLIDEYEVGQDIKGE